MLPILFHKTTSKNFISEYQYIPVFIGIQAFSMAKDLPLIPVLCF